ncbi:composite domain of metallo-dependent hydrolase [Phellopilus nigrolimitatus]|nr:composite domain of metallo-dependent hydrolase [Phellopilus nigrolimitatus]
MEARLKFAVDVFNEGGFIAFDVSRRVQALYSHRRKVWGLVVASLALYLLSSGALLRSSPIEKSSRVFSPEVVARCRALDVKPVPTQEFYRRKESDRFVLGTKATLVENATIWTGDDDGQEVFNGDVLMDKGMIKWVGKDSSVWKKTSGIDLTVVDAKGAWLTPGIIDVHSHLAVGQAPASDGADDSNSLKGTSGSSLPWLRSLDGLNTHDEAIRLAVAGGLTTSLILPGSANAIGGQGFAIKLRPTSERTPTSWLLEPPYGLNGSAVDYSKKPRWRHMKHACGENPSRVYGQSRMDTAWDFRKAYNKARELKEAQDTFCEKVLNGEWDGQSKFPEELQWEAAVDVLRGKVKVQTHCYEAVDLDNFVRLSNEFKFPVAAFHHAHETYLVPEVLKRAYGDVPPASAMFASFSRYKREAYRHSEFAPRILHDAGLRVVMKSDHPAIVSRYLLHEAQQAHYYGLPSNIALKSVISTAAEVLGYDHRIGYIREGYDADIVLWDSHPLQIGATPVQVFIDGISQFQSPHIVEKPFLFHSVPETPNFDKEAKETLEYEGLPPLIPQRTIVDQATVFTNVSNIWLRKQASETIKLHSFSIEEGGGVVVVEGGKVICEGSESVCAMHLNSPNLITIDLRGGSISPGLVSYGTDLGLQEIGMEESTIDGTVYDGFSKKIPKILGGDSAVIRAADDLIFSTRNALLAHRAGVTSSITAPTSSGFLSGLSTQFSTGAAFRTTPGAVIQDVAALHVTIGPARQPSVSTQIAALRRLLTSEQKGELGYWLKKVVQAEIPLVVDIHSADEIATLLLLKQEVEAITGNALRLTVAGASEAHLLAGEIGEANVGVILNPVRPYPDTWEKRRILPGPPLSDESALVRLLRHNVTVGFGVMGGNLPSEISPWAARNTRFDVSWAYIEAGGRMTKSEAFALASTNTERLLGINSETALQSDMVATQGGDLLEIGSKVVGIISPRRARVELL